MAKPGSSGQFSKRMQRVAMESTNARRLVLWRQSALARRILRGNAGRAAAGMARQRLDAAKREHKTAGGIAPISAERHCARDVERRDDFAAGAEANLVAQVKPGERVVHQKQRLLERRADMIGEFYWCGAGAAFAAIDDDEIRRDAGLEHRFADAEKFPGMTDESLKPTGLPPESSRNRAINP